MNLDLNALIKYIDAWMWGWPLVGFVIIVGIVITLMLGFVQFRYFISSFKYVLHPEKGHETENYMTPLQAFLSILSASIGNGSLAGMAVAVMKGGPGAAFWIFMLGFLYMAIRYAEVYVGTAYQEDVAGVTRGGPMVYINKVPGGKILATAYAFFLLGLSLITGNAVQCNSIHLGFERLINMPAYISAALLFVLVVYIMFGGAKRIIYFTEAIVPIKVGLFFVSSLIILAYHYASILPAIKTIVLSALTPQAMAGGLIGFSVQQAIRYGMSLSLNATEVGLGTAGIFYGATKTANPVKSSIMSMASSFVSSHLVGCMMILMLVASGVWNSGLQSTQLTMAAYESTFGSFGGVIVAFLSITFGLGVLVAYAYVGRECWLYLTGGRFNMAYTVIYSLMALVGVLARIDVLWNSTGIVNAGLVAINLYALLYFLKPMRQGLRAWERQ